MRGRSVSIATVVAATLVIVTTVVLFAFGLTRYVAQRKSELARLRQDAAAQADELAAGLALPVWNFDTAQIDRIIDGLSDRRSVQGVVVSAAGHSYGRSRDAAWKLVASDGKTSEPNDAIVEERPITFSDDGIGSVRLVVTPSFVQAELRRSLIDLVLSIIAIDLLLVFSVYVVLFRAVIRPLMDLERYAALVRTGSAGGVNIPHASSSEMAGLALSLESMVDLLEKRYVEIADSEQRFRTIFDGVNDAIAIQDPATRRIVDVNAKFCAMFGYSKDEAIGLDVTALSSGQHPYTNEGASEIVRSTSGRAAESIDWHSRRRDGTLFWTEVNFVVTEIAGAPRVIVAVRDITQRRLMEETLSRERQFTDLAIDTQMGTFFVASTDGRFVRWNRPMAEMRSPLDMATARMGDLVYEPDRPVMVRKIAEVLSAGSAQAEMRLLVPSTGAIRHYLLNGRKMEADGEDFIVVTGLDVTDRHNAAEEQVRLQKAVAQSATEWRQTFDSVSTPIVIIEHDGHVRRMNHSAADLAGLGEADGVASLSLASFDAEPWRTALELVRSATDRGSWTRVEAHDASGRTWDINVSPLFAGEETGSLIVIFWDITDIVELQRSLRYSETMSTMGSLVAGVAHEVRNPLFGMTAMLDAYAPELSAGGLQDFSTGLRTQVTRMTQLTRDLLEYGRPVRVNLVPGAVHDVINEVAGSRSRAASDANVKIEIHIQPSLSAVAMDSSRLRQVFENLVDNALQHSPHVRTVTVAADEVVHAGREWVECRIEDDGKGFNPEDLDHVFEPFFTRREKGTGLGLSIVQRIVEEHSGRITAGNRADGGAVMTVRLPVLKTPESQSG